MQDDDEIQNNRESKDNDKRSEKPCVKKGAKTGHRTTRMWRMMQNSIQRTKSVITSVLSEQALILIATVIIRRKKKEITAIILLMAVIIGATRKMAAVHGYCCVHKPRN